MTFIITIVVFVYLVFSNNSLSRRLKILEEKIRSGGGEIKTDPVNVAQTGAILKDASAYGPDNQEKLEQISQTMNSSAFTPAEPNKFAIWIKEDWLMKLGVFLFIVGFGWFVSYAFANNWIGPVGRISIGVVAGVIIMAFGFWRMMKYPSQGAIFTALGAGMAMLTIFAGRSIYGFFTPTSVILFDFILAAFVSFASYKFNVRTLAFTAQVLAFVTPLLTAGHTDSIFLFSYLLVVSLATLFLASVTGWRQLIGTSLVFVGMYSAPYILGFGYYFNYGINYTKDALTILNFAYVFSLLYLLSGTIAVVKKGIQDTRNEITLAVLNGLFLFFWIYNVAPAEWSAMIFAGWAVIFAACSFAAFKFSDKLAPFYAYGSVAVAFIAAATSLELDGAALTIAFTVEVLLLVLSVLLLTKDLNVTSKTSWLFLVPMVLALDSMSKYAYANSGELFTKDFAVLVLIAIALITAGRCITYIAKQTQQEMQKNYGSVLVVFGTLYIGYIIWQFVHIFMRTDPDIATMTTLVIFTIFGLIAYFAGLYGKDMARRTYGATLLGFVVFRLIFIDVWDMELFGRVVTFLAIGVLLMSTAFITKNKKNG
ncbi:MAG: DUF2339 domain-containing protein [Candidatus Paceibacterota bacterium]